MSNNDILKKLRVALQLKDTDIQHILQLANFSVSLTELSSFFRNEDHPKFKPCGDQILRNFLNGLVIHYRGPREERVAQHKKAVGQQATGQKNEASKNRT